MPLLRDHSPIRFEASSPTASEVIWPESSDSEADGERQNARRRRIESIARRYEAGYPVHIVSATLRGPFDGGWVNPWRKERTRKRRRTEGRLPGGVRLLTEGPTDIRRDISTSVLTAEMADASTPREDDIVKKRSPLERGTTHQQTFGRAQRACTETWLRNVSLPHPPESEGPMSPPTSPTLNIRTQTKSSLSSLSRSKEIIFSIPEETTVDKAQQPLTRFTTINRSADGSLKATINHPTSSGCQHDVLTARLQPGPSRDAVTVEGKDDSITAQERQEDSAFMAAGMEDSAQEGAKMRGEAQDQAENTKFRLDGTTEKPLVDGPQLTVTPRPQDEPLTPNRFGDPARQTPIGLSSVGGTPSPRTVPLLSSGVSSARSTNADSPMTITSTPVGDVFLVSKRGTDLASRPALYSLPLSTSSPSKERTLSARFQENEVSTVSPTSLHNWEQVQRRMDHSNPPSTDRPSNPYAPRGPTRKSALKKSSGNPQMQTSFSISPDGRLKEFPELPAMEQEEDPADAIVDEVGGFFEAWDLESELKKTV